MVDTDTSRMRRFITSIDFIHFAIKSIRAIVREWHQLWLLKNLYPSVNFEYSINIDKSTKNKKGFIDLWKQKKKRNNFKIIFGRAGYKK